MGIIFLPLSKAYLKKRFISKILKEMKVLIKYEGKSNVTCINKSNFKQNLFSTENCNKLHPSVSAFRNDNNIARLA